jgi:hypothetical protein
LIIGKPERREFDGVNFAGPGFLYLRDNCKESETGAGVMIVILDGDDNCVITGIENGNVCGRKSCSGISLLVIFLLFSLAR